MDQPLKYGIRDHYLPSPLVGQAGIATCTERLMNGQPAEALTLMRTELVIRESCGCRPPVSNDPQAE